MHVGAGFGGSSPKINLLQYYLITVPQVCISTVLWAPYLGEVHVNGISHQNLAGAYLGAESKEITVLLFAMSFQDTVDS